MSLQILAGEKFLVALGTVELLVGVGLACPGPGVNLQVAQQLLLYTGFTLHPSGAESDRSRIFSKGQH